MEYKFTIPLRPITKKNSQRIIKDGSGKVRIIPSAAYKKYEKQCGTCIPHIQTIDRPVNVKAVYYMPNRRRVDLINLHEALHDILCITRYWQTIIARLLFQRMEVMWM